MPALQFKRRYVAQILDGSKTATLRAALPPCCEPGAIVTLMNGYRAGAKFGSAKILSVRELRVPPDITDEVARLDGFASRDGLLGELDRLYRGPTVWQIRWEFPLLGE